jgi:hypothetical protein
LSQDKNPPPEKRSSRRAREAEALRLNLARRKAQQRSRAASPNRGPDETLRPGDSPAKAGKGSD